MANLRDLVLRLVILGDNRSGPALREVNAGARSASSGIERLEVMAKRILGITLFARMAKEAISLSDTYKVLQARLRLVSDTSHEYAVAEEALFKMAQRTRSSLEATYTVYGKVETVVKLLGGTQLQSIAITETLNKAIALTSQGASQDKAAILQFSQALSLGQLRGDELNSVMENAPGLAKALADGLGLPTGKLRELAEAGQLTADKLVGALGRSKQQIDADFALLPITVSGAITQVNNALLRYVGESATVSAATGRLSGLLQLLAENFNETVSIIILVAELYGARLVANLLASAAAFLENARSAGLAALATEQARLASLALLRVEFERAELGLRLAAQALEAAEAEVVMARTLAARADATFALTAAQSRFFTSQLHWQTADAALSAGMLRTAASVGLLTRAVQLLGATVNRLLLAWIAVDIGKTVGEWVFGAEKMRVAGSYINEALALISSGARAMINGSSFAERWAEIEKIHAEFEVLRKKAEVAAKAEAVGSPVVSTIIAAAKVATETVGKLLDAQAEKSKKLVEQIDRSEQAATAALEQQLQERIAAIDAYTQIQTVLINASASSEELRAKKTTKLIRESQDAKRRAIDEWAAQATVRTQHYYQSIVELEKAAGRDTRSLQQAAAAGQLAILSQREVAYKQSIDALVMEEQRLLAVARSAAEERAGFNLSLADRIRTLQQRGMTDFEAYNDRLLQIDQKTDAARTALAAGNAGDAKKLAEAAISLAESNARAVQKNVEENGQQVTKTVVTDAEAAAKAILKIKDASLIVDQALSQQEALFRSAAANMTASLEQVRAGYGAILKELNTLRNQQTVNLQVALTVDEAQVTAVAYRLEALLDAKKLAAKVAVDAASLDRSLAEAIQAANGKAPVLTPKIKLLASDISADLEKLAALAKAQAVALPSVLNDADTLKELLKLQADLAVPTKTTHTITDNAAEVQSRIDSLKQPTQSQHTIYVTQVEQHSAGGLAGAFVRHFAVGGPLPGYGGGDKIPAMLEAGEYIIRKEAVKSLGLSVLDKINKGVIPAITLPPVAKASETGLSAASGDTLRLQIVGLNGEEARVLSPRDEALRLVRIMKSAGVKFA